MIQPKHAVVAAMALMVTLWVAASHAQAQTSTSSIRFFASVDGGFQSGSQRLSDRSTFGLFDEDGTTEVDYDIGRSAGLLRASGGVQFWEGLGVAVGFTRTSSTGMADVTVLAPHPLFFGRPRRATTSLTEMGHRENMVHFQGVWVLPLNDRVEIIVSGGPSRISMDQAVVTEGCPGGSCLSPEVSPFNSVDITAVTVEELTGSGVGFNLGVDLSFMYRPRYGVGVFAQYVGGSVEFPFAGGRTSVDAGGFQVGGGLRLRFGAVD